LIGTLRRALLCTGDCYVCSQDTVNKMWRRRKLIHMLFNGLRGSLRAVQPMRLVGALLPVGQIFSSCLSQRGATDEKRAGRAADRVCAGAGDHAADDIAPAGKKLQDRSSTLAENHSCADICA